VWSSEPILVAGRSYAALMEAFLEERRARRYSESALRQVRYVLPRLFDYLRRKRVREIRAVKEEHLVDFGRRLARAKTRYGRPAASSTLVLYLGTLRRFFSFLDRRDLILSNPARHVRFPKVDKLPRTVLSLREARRLMEAPSAWTTIGQRDRAILELLYGAGVRSGECLRIDLQDLDLARGQLMIRSGKGRKDRVVPVRGRAAAALQTYLREVRPELLLDPQEPALFLSRAGRRLEKVTLGDLIRNHALRAGIIKPVSPHVLRHSCATHLLKGGADVRHVQALLGHARLETTAVYTRVEISDLRAVVDRRHPRKNG
jgi:integrase/recombinase XerD